jgi:two-component sensor histidine kinase
MADAGSLLGTAPASRPRLRWPLGAATTVIAINSALIVIIFAIFAVLCVQGYQTTLQQAEAKAQSAADVVAQEAAWMIGGAHGLLEQIAATTQSAGDIDAARIAATADTLSNFPSPSSIAFYDASGSRVGMAGALTPPASIGQEPFFVGLKGGPDWAVSPQMADAKGQPIFVVAQRLGTSSFGGAVVLAISGNVLKTFWGSQQLGPQSTVSLVRSDGWLIGRYPELTRSMNLAGTPGFANPDAETGTYVSPASPADGVARVVAFHRWRPLGLTAFASVSQDAAFAGLWSSIIIVLWLMLPIAVALLVASLITASLLRRSARTQANLTKALASNEVLFREIHHRVKNNLQSVASLFQMQPIPREVKADMSQRIAAMSAVHEHIYRSDDFAHVRVKQYLQTLIEGIRAGQPNVQVIADLEDLSVDKDSATPLGLILNEVVSNSFKHAFKDGRLGVVTVHLRKLEDGTGCLTVEDNGVGFDPATPAKGIGRRLIAALTQQLGGELGFSSSSSGGARFVLSFPLSRPD